MVYLKTERHKNGSMKCITMEENYLKSWQLWQMFSHVKCWFFPSIKCNRDQFVQKYSQHGALDLSICLIQIQLNPKIFLFKSKINSSDNLPEIK